MILSLDWLVGNCRIFGLHGQNWMLLLVAALVTYALILYFWRRPPAR
ncbi:MAG TPA: hypothetical protein VFT69_13880 [Pseudolabrys sp.]|nr:hypothetical protein [Pseudolabrys sp.]